MKFIAGKGYLLSVNDYESIQKIGDQYFIPCSNKSATLKDTHRAEILEMICNKDHKKDICAKYTISLYALNRYLDKQFKTRNIRTIYEDATGKCYNERKQKNKKIVNPVIVSGADEIENQINKIIVEDLDTYIKDRSDVLPTIPVGSVFDQPK